MLTTVDGGYGSETRVVTGVGAAWFAIKVDDSFGDSTTISYRATLEMPAGMDYDLRVYNGGIGGSSTNCAATPVELSNDPALYSNSWFDRKLLGDDRWIVFEVHHVSGQDCSDEATWKLTIEGNSS